MNHKSHTTCQSARLSGKKRRCKIVSPSINRQPLQSIYSSTPGFQRTPSPTSLKASQPASPSTIPTNIYTDPLLSAFKKFGHPPVSSSAVHAALDATPIPAIPCNHPGMTSFLLLVETHRPRQAWSTAGETPQFEAASKSIVEPTMLPMSLLAMLTHFHELVLSNIVSGASINPNNKMTNGFITGFGSHQDSKMSLRTSLQRSLCSSV